MDQMPSSRRLLAVLLGLAIELSGAGCHSEPASSSQPAHAAISATGPATHPAGNREAITTTNVGSPDSATAADAIAQRANTYAKQLEPLLAERAGKTAPPATQPTQQPSKVEWIQPTAPSPALANPAADATAVSKPPREVEVAKAAAAVPAVHSELSASVRDPAATNHVATSTPITASDDLAHKLAQHVKDYPQDIAGQLDFQLLQFVRGQSVPDMPTLAGLGAEDREVLAALLDGLSNFRNVVRADNNVMLARKVRPILDAAERLRTQAELTIPTIALCTKVYNFGTYDAIEPARFVAGADSGMVVYCEVENFSSQLDGQKFWQANLREEIVLYSDQGMQVWSPDSKAPPPTIDRSRTRRHDFFMARVIKLPPSLPIGRYILKVSIVDQQVNRVAENSTTLDIVAR